MKELKTIEDYLNWLFERGNSGGVHTLDKIRLLLAEFDNPQDKLKIIHVAGTNGKGSTSKFIANSLSKTVSCGLFTSPYMKKINESISISGEDISDDDLMKYIDKIKPVAEKLDDLGYHNTYFEVLTAIMYLYFYEKKVKACVVEVGLGGLLDSTNIIKKPIASVITTISKDHIDILGNSFEEIAVNKAGIIKKQVPVFVYPQKKEVMEVIKLKAKEENSTVYTFEKNEVEIVSLNSKYNEFSFRNYKNIKTKLLGIHQTYNASLALLVLNYFKDKFELTDTIIKHSLYHTNNRGRLELLSKEPRVLIDGSHNEQAIDSLVDSLKTFDYQNLIIGFSVLKDKNFTYMISKLSKIADKVIITSINNPRAMNLKELELEFSKVNKEVTAIEDRIEAYKYSKKIAGDKDLVVWCGSLYLIGDLMKYEDNLLD